MLPFGAFAAVMALQRSSVRVSFVAHTSMTTLFWTLEFRRGQRMPLQGLFSNLLDSEHQSIRIWISARLLGCWALFWTPRTEKSMISLFPRWDINLFPEGFFPLFSQAKNPSIPKKSPATKVVVLTEAFRL